MRVGVARSYNISVRSHLWITVGLFAGLALGLAAAATQQPALLWTAEHVRPLGSLFLNLLSMVVIPLVATATFTGLAGMGRVGAVGRLGVRTLAVFLAMSAASILIGFAVASIVLPLAPITDQQQAALRLAATQDSSFVVRAAQQIPSGARFFVELIPANPVRAAVDGALLPLIVFIAIAAVATASLPPERRAVLLDAADGATQALIRIVHWVLALAPIGVFAVVAPVVAHFGLSLVQSMLVFFLAVLLGLAILAVTVFLPVIRVRTGLGLGRFVGAGLPSMLMAFSTASSLAALPAMLDAAERDLGVSRSVSGFVVPLGTSISRAGSALYQAVALLFIARLYGITFGVGEALQAGVAVLLVSFTVAAVPSSSVISLAPAFSATGLPLAGLNLLLGLDRIPDMFRTTANVVGNLAATVAVAARERERPR
jgi:Na+/H+-dicarboxylate symporter